MKPRAAIVFFIATAVVARVADAQVTTEDAKCRSGVQKSAGKLGAATNKLMNSCIKSVLAEKIPAPPSGCSDVLAIDFKGKLASSVTKTMGTITSKCGPANATALAQFPVCPSPGHGLELGGATSGVDDYTELANCETTINTFGLEPARQAILNPDFSAIIANPNVDAISGCANAIAKNATKLWSTVSKERGKCQAGLDKSEQPYAYGCTSYDAAGKIGAGANALLEALSDACGALTVGELALLRSCADTVAGIAACVTSAIEKNAGGLTAEAFEFSGVCPTRIEFVTNSATGPGTTASQHLNRTDLDKGWNGLFHDLDAVGGVVSNVDLVCDSSCSSCAVTASCATGNCRCSNDASIHCTAPFTQDVCGAGNTCLVQLQPPTPIHGGGTPLCVLNTLDAPLNGDFDAGLGTLTVSTTQRTHFYVGISQTHPCPTCSGATIGAAGTCNGGARNGAACKTDGIEPTHGSMSYDCPPRPIDNISGVAGIVSTTPSTTGSSILPYGDSCDAPISAAMCACGVCSGDNTVACNGDASCAGLGLGTCEKGTNGYSRHPNSCSDLICTPNTMGSTEGHCAADPPDQFCDGATTADGQGYISCLSNADCSPFPAGNCTLTRTRNCFLAPVKATGSAGLNHADLASAYCMPGSASNAFLNAALGLPGPVRDVLDVDLKVYCPDGSTIYEPGGSNCP